MTDARQADGGNDRSDDEASDDGGEVNDPLTRSDEEAPARTGRSPREREEPE